MKKSILLFAAFGILVMGQLQAFNFKTGGDVQVSKPVSGNLYTACGELRINAPIGGDLVCAAGEIEVNAPIGADLLLAGGKVEINSPIGGDLRFASGEATLSANVAGDLLVAGGELTIPRGVLIGGDVRVAGGKIIFEGTAQGNMWIAAGEVYFEGIVEGNFEAKGGEIYINGLIKGKSSLAAEELNIGSEARFYSNVEYWNERGDADFDGHLENGASSKYNEHLKFKTSIDREVVKKGFAAFAVYRFASGLLLITLLIGFFGHFFNKNTGNFRENAGSYVKTGAKFWILVPLVSLLAFITVIGIPVGFILMSGYSVALILAGALTAVIGAYELDKYLNRDWNKGIMIAVATGLFAALKLVSIAALPGRLIAFAATAIAIGAVLQWMRKGWRKADDTPDSMPSNDKNEPQDLV